MNVLLAVDESTHANWAASLLLKLPLSTAPNVHVLHVVDVDALTHPFMTSRLGPQYRWAVQDEIKNLKARGERLVAKVAERIQAQWPAVRATVEKGHPAETIIARVKKDKTDLIVLGAQGLSNIETFFMGSVSQKVATYAPCSVLVTKRQSRAVKHLLLAVDGSQCATASMRFVQTNFLPAEVRNTVVHVWDHPVPPPKLSKALAVEHRESQSMIDAGFKSRAVLLQGHTAEAIVEAASAKRADLVVLGSRGLTGIKRFFLGAVSHKVVKYSDRSVLIVKCP